MEAFSSNTFHLIQCANSIFLNDFLGRIQFKFAHIIQENYSKNWTFDQKMRTQLQFSYGAHSIQTSYCIRVDTVYYFERNWKIIYKIRQSREMYILSLYSKLCCMCGEFTLS